MRLFFSSENTPGFEFESRSCHRFSRSPDWLLGEGTEERQRLRMPSGSKASMATPALLEIFQAGEPRRRGGDVTEDLLKERLIARDGERSGMREAVLLLSLGEESTEHRVVEMSRTNNESPTATPHTHHHMPRRYIRWPVLPRRPSSPPSEHLPEPHDVPDLAAFSDSAGHLSLSLSLSLTLSLCRGSSVSKEGKKKRRRRWSIYSCEGAKMPLNFGNNYSGS